MPLDISDVHTTTTITKEDLVRALALKAETFVTAALLDIGVAADPAETRTLQLAVLQDFIEVHNHALHQSPIDLPEDRENVVALLVAAAEQATRSGAMTPLTLI